MGGWIDAFKTPKNYEKDCCFVVLCSLDLGQHQIYDNRLPLPCLALNLGETVEIPSECPLSSLCPAETFNIQNRTQLITCGWTCRDQTDEIRLGLEALLSFMLKKSIFILQTPTGCQRYLKNSCNPLWRHFARKFTFPVRLYRVISTVLYTIIIDASFRC